MIVVRKITKTEEGFETLWTLSHDQMGFLVTYAINNLLAEGLVQIQDEEVQDKSVSDLQKDLLEILDEQTLPKA